MALPSRTWACTCPSPPVCVCVCVQSHNGLLIEKQTGRQPQLTADKFKQNSTLCPPCFVSLTERQACFFFALISVPLAPDCREAEWKWWHPYVPTGTFGKVPKCKGNEREEVNVDQSEAEVKGVELWGAADEDVLTGEQHQTARLSSLCH